MPSYRRMLGPESNILVTANTEITDGQVNKALESAIFTNWFKKIDPDWKIEEIHLQSIDEFNDHIGFVKFEANIYIDGHLSSRAYFLRGDSVAIFMVLNCDGQDYLVLTKQARPAVGSIILEIPAGTCEGSDRYRDIAAREIYEETGYHVLSTDLIDLNEVNGLPGNGNVYHSPGACDESVRYFLLEADSSLQHLEELRNWHGGLAEEGEFITLEIIPLVEALQATQDAKAHIGLLLYMQYKWKTARG